MTSTLRRNPARAGVVGLTVLLVLVVAISQLHRLPFINGYGRTITIELADAGGLESGDRVEVAGIHVGTVESLHIDGDVVIAELDVDRQIRFGDKTIASVRVGNLLGSKYVELTPKGGGNLASDRIPADRTVPAYDVVDAFGELSQTVDAIDTDQLESALNSVAETFRGSSDDVESALRGLTTISETLAARDDNVSSLLARSNRLAGTLDASRKDISALVQDAALLLTEVDRRRDSLDGLIEHTRDLTIQLKGLVSDNQKQIGPTLAELERVTDLLEGRQKDLSATLHSVARFARVFSNTIGSGPWFDSYIGNAPNGIEYVQGANQ